jgi:EmrB/QacA subfamily drug resistance transporter
MTVNVMRGRRPATGSAGAATPGWAPLAVMLTGTFMIVLDFFIVNVAIPSVQRQLHASAAGVEWVVTAYGLTYGVGLITGGRLGDRYGRRRMFMLGLAAFTLASLACGLATNIEMLNVSRAIQGLGAAVAGPQTLAMIGLTYAGRQRVTAVTAYGVSLGLAAVLGQLFGGVLIQANVLGLDWRSCFLVNLPVGVVALAAARRVLTESRAPAGDSIDLVGTVLVTAGLVAVILPLVDGRQAHWPVWAWALLAAAGPILAGFAGHQIWRRRHGKTPLVDLSVLADRTVGAGLVATGVFYAAMASFFVVLALYLQEGRGLSALGSGAVFTVVGAGYLAASMVPQSVMGRLGRQWPALGGVVMAAGYVALALASGANSGQAGQTGAAGAHHSVLPLLLPLLVTGIGMGMLTAPLTGIVLARVAPEQAGTVSGLQATTVQLGNSIGVAVIGVVFFSALHGGFGHAFQVSLIPLAALPLAATAAIQFVPRARPRTPDAPVTPTAPGQPNQVRASAQP